MDSKNFDKWRNVESYRYYPGATKYCMIPDNMHSPEGGAEPDILDNSGIVKVRIVGRSLDMSPGIASDMPEPGKEVPQALQLEYPPTPSLMVGRTTPGGVIVQRTDPISKIQRLAVLKDKGIISAEEFETKKKQLLERVWLIRSFAVSVAAGLWNRVPLTSQCFGNMPLTPI